MASFKEAISNVYLRLGLTILLLALVLAVASLRTYPYSFESHGYLRAGEGIQLTGNHNVSHTVNNRTLMLSGNGTVVVISSGVNETYSLKGVPLIVHPADIPVLSVIQGNISYRYMEKGTEYRYLDLAIVAFIAMLLGSMFSIYGFTHVMSDLKKEKERRRRGL